MKPQKNPEFPKQSRKKNKAGGRMLPASNYATKLP